MVNYLKSIHSTHLHYIPIMESGTLLHSGDGCSPWGRLGSDTTERLHFHFSGEYASAQGHTQQGRTTKKNQAKNS